MDAENLNKIGTIPGKNLENGAQGQSGVSMSQTVGIQQGSSQGGGGHSVGRKDSSGREHKKRVGKQPPENLKEILEEKRKIAVAELKKKKDQK